MLSLVEPDASRMRVFLDAPGRIVVTSPASTTELRLTSGDHGFALPKSVRSVVLHEGGATTSLY